MKLDYKNFPYLFALSNKTLLEECSELYSNHYGRWAEDKNRVKLSPKKIRKYFESTNTSIATARDNNTLIGYAISFRDEINKKAISWVTQLVVHNDYRKRGVAIRLLRSIWGFSDDYAWGIMSANPYAIRALEKATRRRVFPTEVNNNKETLIKAGIKNIHYFPKEPEIRISNNTCHVNTYFNIDHSDVNKMIESSSNSRTPWRLKSVMHFCAVTH